MAYDRKKLFEQACEVAKSKRCFFVEQVVAFLPCDKSTFYRYYPPDSNEYNAINEILENNRVTTKSAMYKKWFDSENATLQVAFMKLICNTQEYGRLTGYGNEENRNMLPEIKIEVSSPEMSETMKKALELINSKNETK